MIRLSPTRPSIIGALAIYLLLTFGGSLPAQDDSTRISADQLTTWVGQLSSGEYRQRELATLRLLAAGDQAVAALEAGLENGNLETTSSILALLRRLSVAFDPQASEVDIAGETLQRIATQGSSSAAVRANLALQEVRADRKGKAYEVLTAAGVFIGFGEYHLASSIVRNDYHLRIAKDWAGQADALYWFRWLHGVETVILAGDSIDADAVREAANIPDMKNLVIRDTKVTADQIRPLIDIHRLDHFQLVNVPAGDELIDVISKLPLRRNLTLFGTDITADGAERLKKSFPTLEIQCRGGFLGVRCSPLRPTCEVSTVEPGSAAMEAGVDPGDVIIKFGEYDVETFADLQDAISKHTAANKPIPLKVRRIVREVPDNIDSPDDLFGTPQPYIDRPKVLTLTVKLKRQFP